MDHFLQDCPTFHDHRKSYSVARSTDTNLVTVDHLLKDCLTYCYPRENHRGSHTKGLFPWSTMIHNDTTSWPTSTREKSAVAHTSEVYSIDHNDPQWHDILTYQYPREKRSGSHTSGLFPRTMMTHHDKTDRPIRTRENNNLIHRTNPCEGGPSLLRDCPTYSDQTKQLRPGH